MILVISKERKNAQSAVNILYNLGVVSYAETPTAALGEIGIEYRGIIIIRPETIPDLKGYMRKLRAYSGEAPVFAISDSTEELTELFDGVYKIGVHCARLVSEMSALAAARGAAVVGVYSAWAIDASADLENVLVFGNPIELTKTEKMILRYLIRSYPTPKKPSKIIKYSFRHGRAPLETSIRTHISKMNRKFRELTGKNLITAYGTQGYVILTPSLAKNIDGLKKIEATV